MEQLKFVGYVCGTVLGGLVVLGAILNLITDAAEKIVKAYFRERKGFVDHLSAVASKTTNNAESVVNAELNRRYN